MVFNQTLFFYFLQFTEMKDYLSRILMGLAATLLLGLFIWPFWEIRFEAPQYPDGVVMYIYINKIGGKTPGTLQNVNILNHYIGMKSIDPDSIPELKYMPNIVIGFLVSAILVILFDKKWMYWAWLVALTIIFILGLYDFYLWEYDYGHNLDPNAPMKFEGESFQPPLLGTKIILNFVVSSIPSTAGFMAMFAWLLALAAALLKRNKLNA